MAAGAVQDWVKNIKDRLLVKQRLSRNRERKIVRLEGEEERLDRDIVEGNMDPVCLGLDLDGRGGSSDTHRANQIIRISVT